MRNHFPYPASFMIASWGTVVENLSIRLDHRSCGGSITLPVLLSSWMIKTFIAAYKMPLSRVAMICPLVPAPKFDLRHTCRCIKIHANMLHFGMRNIKYKLHSRQEISQIHNNFVLKVQVMIHVQYR